MKTNTLKLLSFTALSVAALAVQQARADMITYDLTAADITVAGDSGPFVSVQIDLTSSTTATITFTSLVSGSDVNLLGGPSAAAINVNATSFTADSVATANNAYSFFTPPAGPFNNGASGSDDGYGMFNQTFSATGGYNSTATSISFNLTDNSGSWSSAANVLTANNKGQIAAANIYVADTTDFSAGAINTGYSGDAVPLSVVPDGGSTLIMLGTALIGLAKARTLFARPA